MKEIGANDHFQCRDRHLRKKILKADSGKLSFENITVEGELFAVCSER